MLQQCLCRRRAAANLLRTCGRPGAAGGGSARAAATAAAALAAPTPGEPPADAAPGPRSAYVHLPFCKRKCFYCDFPVEAVGRPDRSRVQDRMAEYVRLVVREVAASRPLCSEPLDTVFFGGGTPSLVPPALIEALLAALHARFGVSPDAEVSLEADPGTFDASRVRAYVAAGVTRVSVGVQGFQDDVLRRAGRTHGVAEVGEALEAVAGSGVRSWSLDLISGLPGAGPAEWRASLERAVAAAPDHLSVYDLQVEEGTPFGRWFAAGKRPLPLDDEAADMYAEASATLRAAGYEHYEVSNYARPGHRCRHNMVYWRQQPYYAFGLGAASYLAARRFSRPRQMGAYAAWVEEFERQGDGVAALRLPPESQSERLLDCVMLSLRTADGLDVDAFKREYGGEALQRVLGALGRHQQRGLVVQARENGPGLRLADPHGFMLSNDIISDVFAALM